MVAVAVEWEHAAATCYSAGGVSLWVEGGLLCPYCETARPPWAYQPRHRRKFDRVRKYAAVTNVVRECPDCGHVFAASEPDPATSEGL